MKDPERRPGHGEGGSKPGHSSDIFDIEGSDPESLHSGRIPDPQPGHTPLFRALARALTAIEERLRARGGRPLRLAIRVFWGLIAAIGIFLLVGPVINKPLDIDDILASADVDEVDWVARDVRIDYAVERAEDGSFATEVSETYAADFRNGPEPSVERTIVTEFQGHDVGFELHSATVDGEEVEAKVTRKATTAVIRVTPPDGGEFDGQREIAFDYELHHLVETRVDDATQRTVERWDWPLFAPTWPQATKGLDVSFTFSHEVNDALVRVPRAYVGWLLVSGTERLQPEDETAEGVRYSFSNDDSLPPNADVWIHAVFEPGTFVQPPKTPLFWVQTYGPLVPLVLLVVLLLFAVAARRIVWADTAGEPWYLARSTPPGGLSLELAARLLDKPRHAELLEVLSRRGEPAERRQRRRGTRRKRGERGRRGQGSAPSAFGARDLPGSAQSDHGAQPNRTAQSNHDSQPSRRERWLGEVARAGRRAGRLGNSLSAMHWASRWSSDDQVVEQKLRWVPDSYVRDSLIFAPLAMTLVQWGLLRQLSHQVILSIVWWPTAFVLVSTALALAAVFAVLRPRPLTRKGALAVQELKGIGAYAEATRLLDRGPIDEPVLGYAMLLESPRRAGNAAAEMAVVETGDRRVDRGWRTDRFVTLPALAVLLTAVAVLAASIVTVSVAPPPYTMSNDKLTEYGDLPGTVFTQVHGFEIEAKISRDDDGAARVEVVEHHAVEFDDSGGRVPQFAREWPSERLGQNLGFELESVQLDGEDAPYREIPNPESESIAMLTGLGEALTGVHDIDIAYSLSSPAVDAEGGAGEPADIQELRWAGLYSFWEHEYYTNITNPFDGSAPVRPIRVQVTIAPALVEAMIQGGWIDSDFDQDRVPHEHGNWFAPWSSEHRYVSDVDEELHDLVVGQVSSAEDGSLVAVLDYDDMGALPDDAINKYDTGLTADLGVRLAFPPRTFTGVDDRAYDAYEISYRLPFAVMMSLAAVVLAGAAAMLFLLRRAGRRPSASIAAVSYLALPLGAVAQAALFFWTVGPMAGDDARIPGAMVLGVAMWAAVAVQAVMIARGQSAARGDGKNAKDRAA